MWKISPMVWAREQQPFSSTPRYTRAVVNWQYTLLIHAVFTYTKRTEKKETHKAVYNRVSSGKNPGCSLAMEVATTQNTSYLPLRVKLLASNNCCSIGSWRNRAGRNTRQWNRGIGSPDFCLFLLSTCQSIYWYVLVLIHLEMSRGGAIFPATQGFYCDRTTKRTGLLPVKPEAEAFFTKHMLWRQKGNIMMQAGGPVLSLSSMHTPQHSRGTTEPFRFTWTVQPTSNTQVIWKIKPSIISTSVCQS